MSEIKEVDVKFQLDDFKSSFTYFQLKDCNSILTYDSNQIYEE